MTAREVALGDWASEASTVAAEAFGSLTVLDSGQWLELRLCTGSGSELRTRLESPQAPSISGVWPAAAVAERRLAEQFGIGFTGAVAGSGWLRKRVALAARNDVVWPGFKDPSDEKGAPSRRKSLPLGVLPDRTQVEAGEVELR